MYLLGSPLSSKMEVKAAETIMKCDRFRLNQLSCGLAQPNTFVNPPGLLSCAMWFPLNYVSAWQKLGFMSRVGHNYVAPWLRHRAVLVVGHHRSALVRQAINV